MYVGSRCWARWESSLWTCQSISNVTTKMAKPLASYLGLKSVLARCPWVFDSLLFLHMNLLPLIPSGVQATVYDYKEILLFGGAES